MLDGVERKFVEVVRHARKIKVVVNEGSSDELRLTFDEAKYDIRKLTHDVALAIQDYLNKAKRKRQ